jgi:hypothetical protein
MKLNSNCNWTAMRPRFVAPTLGAAGDTSAFFRVQTAPITGDAAGMVLGHRPWSPPIT